MNHNHSRLFLLICVFLLSLSVFILLAGSALAGSNPLTVATDGSGIAVYSDSSGSKKVGILYNGFTDELDLEPTNGRYSCYLTKDFTVWLNQEKAMNRTLSRSDYADYDDWWAHQPCDIFLGEIVQDNTPIYTSPRHKHESVRHVQGTLVAVCGEFGDDYYVKGGANGFVAKSAVRKVSDMTFAQAQSGTYIYDDAPVQTVYASESEPVYIASSATGYSDVSNMSFKSNRKFAILRELGDWVQLPGGDFVEKRFLDPDGDHTYPVAYVKTSGQLDRLNIRLLADTDSWIEIKLCSGVPVHVVSHTDKWAVIFVTGPNGGIMQDGCVQMDYLSFDSADSVRDGTTKVRLTQDLRGDEYMQNFRPDRKKGDILPAGTLLTVLGVRPNSSSRSDEVDRFLCETEDGRYIEVFSPGVLEPLDGTGITATVGSAVRMRTEPNPDAKVLRQVKAKTKVEVLLRGETWTLVKYKDETGYMMSRYLSFP